MNKLNLLPKLAIAGVVLTTAAGASTLLAPTASAVTLQGSLAWDGDTSTWYDQRNDSNISITLDNIDSVDGFENFASLTNSAADVTPIPTTFNFTEIAGMADMYTLDSTTTLTFPSITVDGTSGTVDYIVPGGTEFQLFANGNSNLFLKPTESAEAYYQFAGMRTDAVSAISFIDIPESGEGEVEFDTSTSSTHVPEPGTIIGLLAVGGLSFGLKRKKQS